MPDSTPGANIGLSSTAARVRLSAIAHNYHTLRRIAAPADVCAVVKADAYGHGVGPVARRLESEGCGRFAVATLEEGQHLRGEGIRAPILLLHGADSAQLPLVIELRLTPVVPCLECLDALGREAQRRNAELPFHVKFDTGMGRLGLGSREHVRFAEVLRRYPVLRLEGVATHLARAGESAETTAAQLRRFEEILDGLRGLGLNPGLTHAANSAACLSEPAARRDFVRAGLALYGVPPEPDLAGSEELRPALSWTSFVEHLRDVPAGTPISYGGTFVTSRPTRLALVPVGYADGYRRALGNRGQALVRGRRVPVVGRVCMDMAILDVTDLPVVAHGDAVTLIGTQGTETISAQEMASWLDTIPYEILCGIGSRVQRIHEERA
jgi:alanine racemase